MTKNIVIASVARQSMLRKESENLDCHAALAMTKKPNPGVDFYGFSLVFSAVVILCSGLAHAQSSEQMRTLFAMGKWQDVLDVRSNEHSVDVDLMRLESHLGLSQYAQARENSKSVLGKLQPNAKKLVLLKLMHAAEKANDLAGFSEYDQAYAVLEKSPPPKVHYWRGRMHLVAKRYGRAEYELLKVPLHSEYGIRAQYLLAATEMLRGQPQFAINRFAKLKEAQALSEEDSKVIALAAHSHAKLLYKLGQYEDA
jgi:hypothetical protein